MAWWAAVPPALLALLALMLALMLARVMQRLHYLLLVPGHCPHRDWRFSPRAALECWLADNEIASCERTTHSSRDDVPLYYRVLGSGERVFFLANGVGTDLFMWLPALQAMLATDPRLFEKCRLVVSTYRGLFSQGSDDCSTRPVDISIGLCVEDAADILRHMRVDALDGLIGWSTGAQVGLALALKHPALVKALFLLGPSPGHTLHFALQAYWPWPRVLRARVSAGLEGTVAALKRVLHTRVFDRLKAFNDGAGFHLTLVALAFWGGFPPMQPAYFHEYMRDQFRSRRQIRALLDLILSLNEAPHGGDVSATVGARSVIVSGSADFLTGRYLSDRVERRLPGCRRVRFAAGSHFVLLEQPHAIGQELATFLNKNS